jgi:hypothetical protein
MKREGAVIIDPANIPTLGRFDEIVRRAAI